MAWHGIRWRSTRGNFLLWRILKGWQSKKYCERERCTTMLDFCKRERIYNLTCDGDSFDTFLRNVEGRDRTVLVVKTTLGEIFGGYADTLWESKVMHCHQSCLFPYTSQNVVRVYKWSGANHYIQLCDGIKRYRDYSLWRGMEDHFRPGTSGHWKTFQNEPLC